MKNKQVFPVFDAVEVLECEKTSKCVPVYDAVEVLECEEQATVPCL